MPYNYNRYRRKRIQSEAELTMAQMLQTVLIENPTPPPSNAFFAYEKDVYAQDELDPTPVLTVRPGTFSSTPSGLSINSSTGKIDLDASSIGEYEVTLDIGPGTPYNPITFEPATPSGTYTQTITIITS